MDENLNISENKPVGTDAGMQYPNPTDTTNTPVRKRNYVRFFIPFITFVALLGVIAFGFLFFKKVGFNNVVEKLKDKIDGVEENNDPEPRPEPINGQPGISPEWGEGDMKVERTKSGNLLVNSGYGFTIETPASWFLRKDEENKSFLLKYCEELVVDEKESCNNKSVEIIFTEPKDNPSNSDIYDWLEANGTYKPSYDGLEASYSEEPLLINGTYSLLVKPLEYSTFNICYIPMQNKVSVIEVKYIGDLEWIDAFDKSIITRILQSIKFSNEGVAKWDKFQNKSFGFEFIVPGNYKIIKEGKTEIVFADMDQSSTQGILTVRDTWSYDSKGLKACSDMGELTKDGEICLFKKEGRELVSIEGEGDLLSNSFFIASYVGSAAKRNALNSNIYPNQLYSVFQREVPKIEIKTLTTKDDEDIVFDRIIKSIKIY